VGKTVAIVQSNYIPWKGYFDLIRLSDEFILLDDVQYTRRDWRNRNLVKTPAGLKWLTIPVAVRGRYHATIREIETSDARWPEIHMQTLRHAYARAPHFDSVAPFLESIYRSVKDPRLSAINRRFLEAIRDYLGIRTPFGSSTPADTALAPTDRIVALCRRAGADTYLSGPSARSYLDESAFRRSGIAVRYMDYSGYPEYPQMYPPFVHGVSIVDLLFHTGPDAPEFLLRAS
jgi:hypothetical protein